MTTSNGECKACGCGLNHADVRQLALYYRQEQPSLVAVQYVCPRCGHSEWRQQRPSDLEREGTSLLGDWEHVAEELGLTARNGTSIAAVGQQVEVAPEPPAISLDEYIDFGARLERLDAADLAALQGAR